MHCGCIDNGTLKKSPILFSVGFWVTCWETTSTYQNCCYHLAYAHLSLLNRLISFMDIFIWAVFRSQDQKWSPINCVCACLTHPSVEQEAAVTVALRKDVQTHNLSGQTLSELIIYWHNPLKYIHLSVTLTDMYVQVKVAPKLLLKSRNVSNCAAPVFCK